MFSIIDIKWINVYNREHEWIRVWITMWIDSRNTWN